MKYSCHSNQIAFAIGTGRCGTHLFQELFSSESGVASSHERNPFNETFHKYCKWYQIPIDHEGFLKTKEREIQKDLEKNEFFFEASGHLSLSVKELYERFDAKFLLLIRDPKEMVCSYMKKGWHEKQIIRKNSNIPPSYQPDMRMHHFFGRIVPSGEEFEEWKKLTRVGKLAWYWTALNRSVLENFDQISQENSMIIKIEELDYEKYKKVTEFFGVNTKLTQNNFNKICNNRNEAYKSKPSAEKWNNKEKQEFRAYTKKLAKRFGYESKC